MIAIALITMAAVLVSKETAPGVLSKRSGGKAS
jgi:hypothetical protein